MLYVQDSTFGVKSLYKSQEISCLKTVYGNYSLYLFVFMKYKGLFPFGICDSGTKSSL